MMRLSRNSSTLRDVEDDDQVSRPSKRPRPGHSTVPERFRETGLMRDGVGHNTASFVGSASGIHFIQSVQGALAGVSAAVQSPGSNLVPGEDDRLHSDLACGRQRPLWQLHEVGNEEQDTIEGGFSFDELMQWTSSYFDIWHPCLPFLHAPSILETFETMSKSSLLQQSSPDVTILKAIVSISIADRRQTNQVLPRPPPSYLAFSSYDDALESLTFALVKPATIPRLQAALSVQLFLVSMLRLNGAARIEGLVIAMAFQLGLHRCPARYPSFSTSERQLRQRLFWSIYCVERHLCQALGLPLTIRDDDVDVCYPDKEHHHPERTDAPEGVTYEASENDITTETDSRLKLLSLLARHAQIKGAIMELRNKNITNRDETIDKVVLVDARLTRWWNEVQDVFEQVDAEELVMSDIHRIILTISKHESKIILNRPILAATKDTANYAGALHSCILNSKGVLSTLQRLLGPSANGRNGNLTPQTTMLPMCWPSWTWAVWMSAFVIMFATAEHEVPPQVANRLMDRSLDLLDRLASRGSVWPNACAVAIKDLRVALMQRLKRPSSLNDKTADTPASNAQGPNTTGSLRSPAHPGLQKASAHGQPQAILTPTYGASSNGTDYQPTPDHDQGHPGTLNFPADGSMSGQYSSFPSAHFPNLPDQNSFVPQAFDFTTTALLPMNMMPYQINDLNDPFQGFDIPFWLGQESYAGFVGETV